MDTRRDLSLIATCLGIAAWLLQGHVAVQMADVAWAETDTSQISAACTDPTTTALVPGVDYSITWSAPSRAAAATASATSTLTDPINGESNPAVALNQFTTGALAGSVMLVHPMPQQKLAGLQCKPQSRATLEAHGDGVDDPNINILVSNLADANDSYTAGDQVDDNASAAPAMLFGTGGQIVGSALIDGSDQNSVNDGEIAFGGSVEANGGAEFHVGIRVTNYDVQAASTTETLTFTFTGS